MAGTNTGSAVRSRTQFEGRGSIVRPGRSAGDPAEVPEPPLGVGAIPPPLAQDGGWVGGWKRQGDDGTGGELGSSGSAKVPEHPKPDGPSPNAVPASPQASSPLQRCVKPAETTIRPGDSAGTYAARTWPAPASISGAVSAKPSRSEKDRTLHQRIVGSIVLVEGRLTPAPHIRVLPLPTVIHLALCVQWLCRHALLSIRHGDEHVMSLSDNYLRHMRNAGGDAATRGLGLDPLIIGSAVNISVKEC